MYSSRSPGEMPAESVAHTNYVATNLYLWSLLSCCDNLTVFGGARFTEFVPPDQNVSEPSSEVPGAEPTVRVQHGTTRRRAESILNAGPDPNFLEPGGLDRAGGLSTETEYGD